MKKYLKRLLLILLLPIVIVIFLFFFTLDLVLGSISNMIESMYRSIREYYQLALDSIVDFGGLW